MPEPSQQNRESFDYDQLTLAMAQHRKQKRSSPHVWQRRLLRIGLVFFALAVGIFTAFAIMWLRQGDVTRHDLGSDNAALSSSESSASIKSSEPPASIKPPAVIEPPKVIEQEEMLWNKVRPSVVQIKTEMGMGSGFIVGDDLIATCHHVVDGADEVTVYFSNGTSLVTKEYAIADAFEDIAILRAPTAKAKSLPLVLEPLSTGNPVVSISFFERKRGEITRFLSDSKILETTAESCRGYSGGPLVNYDGKVIGMNTRATTSPVHTLSVAAKEVQRLLDLANNSHRALPVAGGNIRVGKQIGEAGHGVNIPKGNYTIVTLLEDSEVCSNAGHGIYLRGNHVTINLRAGKIIGNGGHGVLILGNNNTIKILGGMVKDNRGNGIEVQGNSNSVFVSDCQIGGNQRFGIGIFGDNNMLEVTGGTILGKNGDDFWMAGEQNQCVLTGGVFGDDGSTHGGECRKIGFSERLAFYQGVESCRGGKCDKAIACLDEAIRLNPTYARAFNTRGNAYNFKNDNAKARADYEEAIRLNPELSQAYINRGNLCQAVKDHEGAIRDYTQAIKTRSELATSVYLRRAQCYQEVGDEAKAVDDILELSRIKIAEMDPYPWHYTEVDEDIQALTERIERNKDDTDKFRLMRAVLNYMKGERKKSIDDCTEVIRRNPQRLEAYVLRGMAHEQENDTSKAAEDCTKAKELIKEQLPSIRRN